MVPNRACHTVHLSVSMKQLFKCWKNFYDIYTGNFYEKLSLLFNLPLDRANVTTSLPEGLCVSVPASLIIDRREEYFEQILLRETKHIFQFRYTFSSNVGVVEAIKQNDAVSTYRLCTLSSQLRSHEFSSSFQERQGSLEMGSDCVTTRFHSFFC